MLLLLNKMALFPVRISLTALCLFLASPFSFGQSYTASDSARIYALLNHADDEALTGSLDKSMLYARQALQISKIKKMPRGEGFAILKIADLLVQQESPDNLSDFFAEAYKIGARLKDSFMI